MTVALMRHLASPDPAQVPVRDFHTQLAYEGLGPVESLPNAVNAAPIVESAGGAADAPVAIYARVDHLNPTSG
jgi:hypothetical protein